MSMFKYNLFQKIVRGGWEPLKFLENLRWLWICSHIFLNFTQSWILKGGFNRSLPWFDHLPASFFWIWWNRSSPRLSFSSIGFSGTFWSSFNVFSTKTSWSVLSNFPSVYISHSSLAAFSLDNRKVAIMEPLAVFTNTAPWGRSYEENWEHW